MVFAVVLTVQANQPVTIYYDWSSGGLDGWERSTTAAALSNPDLALNMQYAAQGGIPLPEKCNAYTALPVDTLVTNISLRFYAAEEKPSYLLLVLHSARSGSDWTMQLLPPEAGVWQEYSVDVSFAAGWTTGPGSDPVKFFNDVLEADSVGVYVYRNGTRDVQNYKVDDVLIQAETIEYVNDPPDDRDGDGMPDTWEDRYSLDMTNPADANGDNDGDGMINYAEYLAGTVPDDDSSIFVVEPMVENGYLTVKWKSIPDRVYTIHRTENIMSNFEFRASGVISTPPLNLYHDMTATNNGTYFYRVGVSK
jgi:hypothetical protein